MVVVSQALNLNIRTTIQVPGVEVTLPPAGTAVTSAKLELNSVFTFTKKIRETPIAKSENRETSINVMYCRGANYRAKS